MAESDRRIDDVAPRHRGGSWFRRALASAALAGLLAACTTDSVLAPPSIVPSAAVANAPQPPAPLADRQADYGAPQASVADIPSYETLAANAPPPTIAPVQAAASGGGGGGLGSIVSTDPSSWSAADLGFMTEAAAAPSQGVLVAPAGAVPVPQTQQVLAAPPGVAPVPTVQPTELEVAALPPRVNPAAPPKASSGIPAETAACYERLRKLGVSFTPKPSVGNGKSCGIANPIELTALSGNVKVRPATLLNCPMAEAFAMWVQNDLAPNVRRRYIAGIDTIGSMGGYSCRTMNNRRGAPMSEHSKGNAIDVGSIKLTTGKTIEVRRKGFFAFRERSLLKTVRSEGCDYFTTILGPGSDANHADHFHFDLRARKSGYRHCD